MSHYAVKCSECKIVIAQCRCPGPKDVHYQRCEKCKA